MAAAAGCAVTPPGGERRSLWEALTGDEEAQLGAGPVRTPPPPARPRVEADAAELLERLRRAPPGDERGQVVAELARRGEEAHPALEEALAQEELLIDTLRDLLRRAPPTPEPAGRARQLPWIDEVYGLALDRFHAGDHYGALRLIDAALVLAPDAARAPELHRLRRQASEEALRASVLAADLVLGAEVLVPNASLSARIELHNRSELPIVLRGDASFGVVTIDYEELLADATRTRIRTQRAVALPGGELELAPGERRTLPVSLPSPHRELGPGAVGRYRLGGRLRPGTMLVGDTSYQSFIPLLPRLVLAVLPADRPLADDPAARLAEAIGAASQGPLSERREPARRAFVAAVLLAQRDREAALVAVASALHAAEGPLSEALCAALGRITGEPFSFTREEWLRWWDGQTARPTRGE